MLLLPMPPQRAWLRSFWAVCSLGTGVACGGLLALGHAAWVGGAVFLGSLLLLPGLLWPEWVQLPYRGWHRLAEFYARGTRHLLSRLCYGVICVVGRSSGASLWLTPLPPQRSLWQPRGTQPLAAYPHPYLQGTAGAVAGGWVRAYGQWAWRTRQYWALALLPFFWLLWLVGDTQERTFPADIYTLF